MSEKETFGQRLRRLRKKAGFTQAELAFPIGVHEMWIIVNKVDTEKAK